MNYSTAVFLINDAVRCVEGIYEAEQPPGFNQPKRVRFKTLDPSIKVGDYVLVPTDTRHKMSVNKVMAVDLDVDFSSSEQMKWVISKVDSSAYEQTLVEETKAIEVMRSAELRSQREKLRDKVLADQKAKDAMAQLAITSKPEPNTP